jgi:hypothetical protein
VEPRKEEEEEVEEEEEEEEDIYINTDTRYMHIFIISYL